MLSDSKPYTFDRVLRLATTAAVAVALVYLLNVLSSVLIPFAVALLLAYLLNPLVSLVQKKLPNRTAAVIVTLVGVALVLALLGYLLVNVVSGEVAKMAVLLQELANNSGFKGRLAGYLPPELWEEIQAYLARQDVQELLSRESVWPLISSVGHGVLSRLWTVLAGAFSMVLTLTVLFVIVLYLVFLLIDYAAVTAEGPKLIPAKYRQGVMDFLAEFNAAMRRHFRAQALVALIVGVLFAAGFWIIGLPMGVLLGLFIGLLNMVPYLQLVALLPAALLALVMAAEGGGNVWVALLKTGLVFVVVQLIQDTLLTPKIMGKSSGLRPAMILLSVSIWGKLLGLLGLLLALPLTCLALAYYRRMIVADQKSKT